LPQVYWFSDVFVNYPWFSLCFNSFSNHSLIGLKSKIKKPVLEKMRKEFRFWYPMDLRVSGKDLVQNHLTMSLYNHACVWEKEPDLWPRGFFCNGWLLVNNEKMSKSKGNFFTLEDICAKHSADAVRVAVANAEEKVAEKALLFFPVFIEQVKAIMSGADKLTEGDGKTRFVDRWFANELNSLVIQAKQHYDVMLYREALRVSYFEFTIRTTNIVTFAGLSGLNLTRPLS